MEYNLELFFLLWGKPTVSFLVCAFLSIEKIEVFLFFVFFLILNLMIELVAVYDNR